MAQHDVFPAAVIVAQPSDALQASELSTTSTRGDQYRFINSSRVVVSGNRAIIATDGAMGPVVVFDEPIDPASHVTSREGDSYFVTLKGRKVAYRKDNSCGCGSRLKSWSPFRFISSTKDPT